MTERRPERQLYRQREQTISAQVLEETVILDLEADRYTRLNGSAGLLWEELAEPRSAAELAERLRDAYGIDSERASADARTLLERLLEAGLLEAAG